jgi:hypothetical protein
MTFPSIPIRMLTPEKITQYHEDGVIMIPQAVASNWLALIEVGLDKARAQPSLLGRFMSRKVKGYQMDIFL